MGVNNKNTMRCLSFVFELNKKSGFKKRNGGERNSEK
jgi:hypothetical protein